MPENPDQQVVEDLRATAGSIAEDAEHLAAIERTKEVMPPDDPAIHGLSSKSRALAEKIRRETALEDVLAEKLDERSQA